MVDFVDYTAFRAWAKERGEWEYPEGIAEPDEVEKIIGLIGMNDARLAYRLEAAIKSMVMECYLLTAQMQDHGRAREQAEAAQDAAERNHAMWASGYAEAFYEVAEMLGIGARACAPKHIWEQEMRPKLMAIIAHPTTKDAR
jgi:hypothetical protein